MSDVANTTSTPASLTPLLQAMVESATELREALATAWPDLITQPPLATAARAAMGAATELAARLDQLQRLAR